MTANTAGTYTLNCTPFTTCAAQQTYTFAVGGAAPVANFVYSPACINSAATFTSTSTGATTYTWNWGDGTAATTGTNTVESHTYTTGGPKQVKLVVANSAGCKDSITIQVTPVPNPIAAFNFTPACVNQSAQFVDATNLNGGPPISNYVWQWNDATPNGTQQNMNHIYTNNGTQTVQLVVTNSSGCKDSITHNLVANPSPLVGFTFNTICEGAPTNFNNTTNANGSNVTNYYWDYNNDGIADNTTFSPSHIFPTSGVFNVGLIAVTDLGCSDSIQQILLPNSDIPKPV
jgi:PKD repeat protein